MKTAIYRAPHEEFQYRLLACLMRPSLALRQLWLRLPIGSFRLRLTFDIFPRPHYAYGVFHAAEEARMLGVPRISVIEFGVAGGNGLVALEKIAEEVEKLTGVAIQVFGFDTGRGLPPLRDYRDLPYKWQTGEFAYEAEGVRKRLKRATLIVGDVNETVPKWCAEPSRVPLGFVAIDVDLYHSTVNALRIFEREPEYLLPRVYTYLDDVIFTSRYLGELLAVREWNAAHAHAKIDAITALACSRFFQHRWLAGMFIAHFFEHPRYNDHTGFLDHSGM